MGELRGESVCNTGTWLSLPFSLSQLETGLFLLLGIFDNENQTLLWAGFLVDLKHKESEGQQ